MRFLSLSEEFIYKCHKKVTVWKPKFAFAVCRITSCSISLITIRLWQCSRVDVNTPFSKYPTLKFGLGARVPECPSTKSRPCTRALSWALCGPCVNTFSVGSLELYPQFLKNEHVLGLLNINIFSDWVTCVWTQHHFVPVLGHQVWTLPLSRTLGRL